MILDDTFWWKVSKLVDLLKPVVVWLKRIEGDEPLIGLMVNIFTDLQEHLKKLFNTTPAILSFEEAENL